MCNKYIKFESGVGSEYLESLMEVKHLELL
jgi:hypothetical protein